MAFKLLAFAAFVAAANALLAPAPAVYHHAAPAHAPIEEYDPHPQYHFAYEVHDAHTGDTKSQQESRDGDVVHGSYSLIEPDGTRRIVEYTADPHSGFNAVVHKEGTPVAYKPAPVIAHAPAYAHAPIPYPYHH